MGGGGVIGWTSYLGAVRHVTVEEDDPAGRHDGRLALQPLEAGAAGDVVVAGQVPGVGQEGVLPAGQQVQGAVGQIRVVYGRPHGRAAPPVAQTEVGVVLVPGGAQALEGGRVGYSGYRGTVIGGHICRWTQLQVKIVTGGHSYGWTQLQVDSGSGERYNRWTQVQVNIITGGYNNPTLHI